MFGVYVHDTKHYTFAEWIIDGKKTIETKTINNLCSLIGKRVYIVKTSYKKPMVIGMVTIKSVEECTSVEAFRAMEKSHLVDSESKFDITNSKSGKKYLYHLEDPERIEPFMIPESAIRHGRVFVEIN